MEKTGVHHRDYTLSPDESYKTPSEIERILNADPGITCCGAGVFVCKLPSTDRSE